MKLLEQLRCTGLFKTRVPRYTSFPPVSRFVTGEGTLHQSGWLGSVPYDASLSLYVHIPYCEALCWFCACRTQAADDRTAVDHYVDILTKEIALVRAQLPDSVLLSRLYLGGGTPTMLHPRQMQLLMRSIHRAFPTSDDFECSVEVDTTNVSQAMVEGLIANGMNRAIVGVQDFDKAVQAEIGRRQSFEQTLTIVQKLKRAGLEHLDMEMLFGLPRQSSATIADTTQQVLALDPDRLAVCEYAHVPSQAKRQILIDARYLPSAEDAFAMSQVARHILLSDGYRAVGMDHFVRPGDSLIDARDSGRLRRDFQGYSDNTSHALIGIGASAISRFPQGYVQNATATSVYCRHVEGNRLAGDSGYNLTHTDHVLACMIEMLMCRFEIDLGEVHARFPGDSAFIEASVRALEKIYGPYVSIRDSKITIKDEMQALARLMCNSLDQLGDIAAPT